MREGYGKSKLFFLVVISLVGILLMPYSLKGNKAGKVPAETGQTEKAAAEFDCTVSVAVVRGEEGAILAEGNGVIIENPESGIWIATAAHVFEGAEEGISVRIGLTDGNIECEVLSEEYYVSRTADIAFVRVEKNKVDSLNTLSTGEKTKAVVKPAAFPPKASYDLLKEGDIVRIRGRGEEGQTEYKGTLRDTWIYVEDFSQYMMTANCSIDPGMSGCGLYDENGALIGIACGGNEENVLTAVPLHVVMAELENLRPPS